MPSKKKAVEKKKSIGIPMAAPEKECKDEKCAWHGSLPVRGRVFKGSVRSAKSHNTVIIEYGYHRFIRKYERYQRQKSRITAHNPPCIRAREGDSVVIAECRPISKTKHFVVVGMQKDFRQKPHKEKATESAKKHIPAEH